MENLVTIIQAKLVENKKSIKFDGSQLKSIVDGLPDGPRWIIQAMYDSTDGRQKRTLEEAATYLGDSSPESAQDSYRTAINTIAKRFWDKNKPQKSTKPVGETTAPESLRDGVYLNDRLVDDMTLAKLNKPIKLLDVSIKCLNLLQVAQIEFTGALVQWSEPRLRKTKKIGRKSALEIKEILAEEGFELGMKLEGWSPPVQDKNPDTSGRHW